MSSFVTVAWLFWRTVAALDPDRLHRRRLERLRQEVSRTVERAIFERIAFNMLEIRCEEAEVQFAPLSSSLSSRDVRVVRAPRSGLVSDIDLRALRSLTEGSSTVEGESPTVELRAYVGLRVTQGQRLLVLPNGIPEERTKKAQRIVRIEKAERSD